MSELPMVQLATVLLVHLGLATAALAQITTTPGPGGIPIAPGAAPFGYTPGGIGLSGSRIAPGPAASDQPMYRRGPGGVPVQVMPEQKAERRAQGAAGAARATASLVPCTRRACLPGGLAFTIDSRQAAHPGAAGAEITSLAPLRAALRACWTPPAAPQEVQMAVRFSLRRSGELIGPPFVTYVSRGVGGRIRQDYRNAITAALGRCAPFRLSPKFAAAIAGQPLSVRFIGHPHSR